VKKTNLAQEFVVLIPILISLFSISRVWNVLPSIMGDEYIYSSQARNLPFIEHTYSNYLFSWVMSFTNTCGPGFYSCTKAINSIFFIGTVVLTFVIARRLMSISWAAFASSIIALSPISIPVSHFMPETMYFFMMLLTVWTSLLVAKNPRWWAWGLPGAVVGLSSLVKPHAVFLVPAFLLFALIVQFKSSQNPWLDSVKSAAANLIGFTVAKFGVGFIFAGEMGLRLFGGYGSPVNALNSAASVVKDSIEAEPTTGIEILLQVSSSHILAHTAALLFLAGIPLLTSLNTSWSAIRTKQPINEDRALSVLVVLISVTMIGVVSVFEAYVSTTGDDHSNRLILRYYEFLLPMFVILGLNLVNSVDTSRRTRVIQGIVVTLAALLFAIFYPVVFQKQYADSSTLPGIGSNSWLMFAVGAAVVIAVLIWVANPTRGNQIVGRALIPLVLVVALISSQIKLIETNGTLAYFDVAGQMSERLLDGVPGEKIMVVGDTRTEIFTVKFWIDTPAIKHLIVGEESVLRMDLIGDVDYVVTLGNITLDVPNEPVQEGAEYRITKITR
jgi:phosphoglycerol transferase